ncbi:MAG: chemotaxis protein CheA, partial [bacterium]
HGTQLLVRMVRAISEGLDDAAVNVSDFIRELEGLEKGIAKRDEEDLSLLINVPLGMTDMLSEYEEHRFRDNIGKRIPFYKVTCSFPLESFDVDLEKLGAAIKSAGELLTTLPETEMGGEGKIGFTLYFTSREPGDKIRKAVEGEGRKFEAVPFIERRRSEDDGESAPFEAPARSEDVDQLEDEIRGMSQTVRVDILKLDHLMNLVGELVILRSSFTNVSSNLRASALGIPTEILLDLDKSNSSMEKKLVDLRDAVMDIRMVPMGQLYNRLQRVAKKIARDLDKKVNLQFMGHDTELDKMIMEEMVSPLLHIVRNSLDHGIEDSKTRRAKGKNEIGTVKVSAFQQGNHVVLEVEDDGKGIDIEKARRMAIQRGEIRRDDAVSTEEILDLLFKPGFSTKEGVTELSGRGVGMDVVRKDLENIGGTAEIHTVKDKGTRVTLTLPITLAILQALLVRSGGRTFAIPMGSIQETIELTRDQIKTMQGREVITLRDRTLPLIRLERIFHLDPEQEDREIFAVIVGMASRTMGLVAGELLGKQDIVIKPLGDSFSKSVGLAGAAELGDQSTILVLDVAGLMMEAIKMGAVSKRA